MSDVILVSVTDTSDLVSVLVTDTPDLVSVLVTPSDAAPLSYYVGLGLASISYVGSSIDTRADRTLSNLTSLVTARSNLQLGSTNSPTFLALNVTDFVTSKNTIAGHVSQAPTGVSSSVNMSYRYNTLDLSGTSAIHTVTLTVPGSSPCSGRILLVVGGFNVLWAVSSGTKVWAGQPDWATFPNGSEFLVMWDYDGSRTILAATNPLS